MATDLRKAAWQVPCTTLGQKLVLVLLCDLPLRGQATCSPSKATLMLRTGLDAPQLEDALAALRGRDLVSQRRRENTSNEYTINVPALLAQRAQVLGGQRAG